jgi:hypothetical protein
VQAATAQRPRVRLERPIAAGRIDAAGELAADRGRRAAHERRDLADRAPLLAQVGQAHALVFGQVAR